MDTPVHMQHGRSGLQRFDMARFNLGHSDVAEREMRLANEALGLLLRIR